MTRPWTIVSDGLLVTVRLTPKGGRDAIEGIQKLADGGMVLKARVRAPPSDGVANTALLRLIAQALDVAPRAMSLVGGASARIKRVKIAGDGAKLAAVLEKIIG